MYALDPLSVAAMVATSRAEQGLPAKVTDPDVLRRVESIFSAAQSGRASQSAA
jgi:hypothetical protein